MVQLIVRLYCRTSPHLKGSKGLMRSPSAHYKEPDSMLLKKSWSSHEGTQLSARWSGIPFLQGSQSQAKVTSRQQSWCSNLSFTIGNPCMISLCYCQNLWKHPGVFLMCMLAEIRCSACNYVKLLCVCDIEEITVITEWLVIVHIPTEGSYNTRIQ